MPAEVWIPALSILGVLSYSFMALLTGHIVVRLQSRKVFLYKAEEQGLWAGFFWPVTLIVFVFMGLNKLAVKTAEVLERKFFS